MPPIKSLDELKELAANAAGTTVEELDPMQAIEDEVENPDAPNEQEAEQALQGDSGSEEETEEAKQEVEGKEETSTETPSETGEEAEVAEENADAEIFNFDRKIKSVDKEYEIPEWVAKNVSNEEEAKELREVYEKAHGIDFIKSKNEHLKTEVNEFKEKYETNENVLKYMDNLVTNKDVANIQKMTRLSDDDILQRAHEILQVKDLTPEQQQAYNNQVEARNQLYQQKLENDRLTAQIGSTQAQSHEQSLNSELSKPEVQEIMNFYDGKLGKVGSFKEKIIGYAANIERETGGKTVLTPEQAVNAILGEVKPFFIPNQATKEEQVPVEEAQAPAQPQAMAAQADPRKKPVIPKISGGQKSPAKRVFKSIQDLKDHAATFDD